MMPTTLAQAIATDLRQLHHGGNWAGVSLKQALQDLPLELALHTVPGRNSIAVLLAHVQYYAQVQLAVLRGGPLEGKDEESFELPPLSSEADWQSFQQSVFSDAEELALLVEELPDEQLLQPFSDEKYGSYYRNLAGMIQHTHYHLGQMVLLRKWKGY